MKQQLFDAGQILATPGALELAQEGVNLLSYLARHISGDWGDLDGEDKQENDFSLDQGFRLISAYNTPEGRLWVITEADRSATTLLCPYEY